MIKKLKSYSLAIVTLLTFLAPTIVAPLAASAAPDANGCDPNVSITTPGLASGGNLGNTSGPVNCNNTAVGNNSVATEAQRIVTLFSIIVGAISVVMIIYGGFRYITSGGDSGRVGNAKNTLIYAIIGLVIVALAQLIVHFVLAQTNTINTSTTS